MQALYKVEIFDREYNFKGFAPLQSPSIQMDYLTLEKTTIHAVGRLAASRGDYAAITDMEQNSIYQGQVVETTTEKNITTLKLAPLYSLFDCAVWIGSGLSGIVENDIERLLKNNFQESGDPLQNLAGLNIKKRTATNGTFDIRSSVHEIWDIATKALTMYDVAIECALLPGRKALDISIGQGAETVTIEADLENCLAKSVLLTDDFGGLNKMTFYDKDTGSAQGLTFYLHPDGSITQKNTDRITPVFFSADYIEGATDFEQEAWQRASDAMIPQKYQQSIELSFLHGDRLVHPEKLRIGTKATIWHEGKAYSSILTGYRIDGKIYTLIFGAIRVELTKKLILEKRRQKA